MSFESYQSVEIKEYSKGLRRTERKLTNTIMKYIVNTKHTSTVKVVTLFVNKSLNSTYFIGYIRVFMKIHIDLSFKRVKSKTSNINLDKIFSIRNLFTIKFTKIISKETLLINIDESSINRNIKSNCSWGFKWLPIEVRNAAIEGSVSIIMGICSNDSWINLIINKTNFFTIKIEIIKNLLAIQFQFFLVFCKLI